VMHCFLFGRFGLAYDNMPAWFVEGAPTWVMATLGGGNPKVDKFWRQYLDKPTFPLTRRGYTGLGFFVHLAESGTDVWTAIDAIGAAMVKGGAGASAAGWAAAGVTPAFLDSWGAGYVQGRYPGAAWHTGGGPNLADYRPALPNGRLAEGGRHQLTAPAFATAVEQLDV